MQAILKYAAPLDCGEAEILLANVVIFEIKKYTILLNNKLNLYYERIKIKK